MSSAFSNVSLGLVAVLLVSVTSAGATSLRTSARTKTGIRLWDENMAQMRLFASHKAAMEAGMEVGHHPSLDECHRNCERAKGCGDQGVCLCSCCGGNAGVDGCFCYSCGPLGMPVHEFSLHNKDALEEPETCPGSKAMCGESAFSQAEKDAAEMKRAEMNRKIKEAQEKERLAEEKNKRLAKQEEMAKERAKALEERARQISAFQANGEEKSKKAIQAATKKATDSDMLEKQTESKLKAALAQVEGQKETIKQHQDSIVTLEAEMKSVNDQLTKEKGVTQRLQTELSAASGKAQAESFAKMSNSLKKQ